jgi:putative hydrolase of the HAD superfamily
MNELCVVFDIDDTLYLERDYVFSGFNAVGPWAKTWLGIPDFAERCRRAHESGTRGRVFNQVLEGCGIAASQEKISALLALYRSHIPTIALCDDAKTALMEVASRWPIAVITDGPAISQSRKADALGLHVYSPAIYLTELFGRECSKPSPVAFRKVEESIPAKSYVYVADNPAKDFTAPRLLGWYSVRVRRRDGLHFSLDNYDAKPDAEMADCNGLTALLSGL